MSKDLSAFRGLSSPYYMEALEVLIKKQADYGPKNIALAPGGPLN